MLVKNVSFSDFVQEFRSCGRENQFSDKGKKALFDYLEELSEDMGEPIELDVIALCCDFTEYNSVKEFNRDYGEDIEDIEDIRDFTTVIQVNEESFIIQNF